MAGKSKIVKGALGQIVDLADWLTGKKKFYPEKEGPGIHDSLSEQKVFAENIDFFRAAQAAKTKKEKEAVRKKSQDLRNAAAKKRTAAGKKKKKNRLLYHKV